MRIAIVGLGIQGRKRLAIAGADVVATVDPAVATAQHRRIEDVPRSAYDAAIVCAPDHAKPELLRYLLTQGKSVMVEKPLLASDPEAIAALEVLARARGVACYTAYNHRFEPHLVELKRTVESGALGPLYLARFWYGNGTARDVRQSPWRDQGLGVLGDLGSHLLDIAQFVLGQPAGRCELWTTNQFENRSPDHALFGFPGRPTIELEASLLCWRNTFTADVFGELGSAHVHGLCKWGPSWWLRRARVFPSGKPQEEVRTLECPDPTWALEYEHFKALCQRGQTDLSGDRWINETLNGLARRTLETVAG